MAYKTQAKGSVRRKAGKGSKLPLVLSVCAILALVISYFVFPGFEKGVNEAFRILTSEDRELIREWVSQFGFWGPLVILVAMVVQMFLFIVPNVLLILICILSYGPVWGGLLAWLGIFLASTVGYFIGNKLSPVVVNRLVSAKTQETLQDFIKNYGMKAIFVMRVSSLSNDGLSLVAGLLKMQYRRFIGATLLGITPLITVLAIFGHNGKIEKGLLWVGGFLLTCLVIYIVIDKRRSRRGKAAKV